MFSAIAGRYDLLNRLLSFGQDQRWRGIAAKAMKGMLPGPILDLASGTGDLALKLVRSGRPGTRVVAADFSYEMLARGRAKLFRAGVGPGTRFVLAQAEYLPFKNDTFSGVTIAFGVRNFVSVDKALSEVIRVLRHGGQLAVLEFSMPTSPLWGRVYRFYLDSLLPSLAGVLSLKAPYIYLSQSVQEFPDPGLFAGELLRAGLRGVTTKPLSLGIVTLYLARLFREE